MRNPSITGVPNKEAFFPTTLSSLPENQIKTHLSLQENSIRSKNNLQFNFQDLTHGDLISGVFDNLFRENEEFLVAFDLCREDL